MNGEHTKPVESRTEDQKAWAYEVGESVAEAIAQNSLFSAVPNTKEVLDAIQHVVQQSIADHWPPPKDPT